MKFLSPSERKSPKEILAGMGFSWIISLIILLVFPPIGFFLVGFVGLLTLFGVLVALWRVMHGRPAFLKKEPNPSDSPSA